MKTVVIIQARMGSSRLPGKVLMPLGDTVVLDYVVTRCNLIDGADEVVVATSVLPQDDVIEDWCRRRAASCFRGSEDDVLSRYVECARAYGADRVMRVTADCPFIDYELAGAMIRAMDERPADLVALRGELPRGLPAELFAMPALERIHREGKEPRHREHVTYYAYEYPDRFQRTTIDVPEELRHPRLRITLDTEEDYRLCQAVAEHFRGDRRVPSREVVRFLLDHPEVAALNAHVRQKPVD
ncbi:MAG: acylneuraminate cytidylyltransferase [Paenibacillaceae bacterium ZCTH02-B3]|nr:MAG: acylneuraminate cytidylyltransferase [Paenibacillaceae bacterium ZCTH02-B3]